MTGHTKAAHLLSVPERWKYQYFSQHDHWIYGPDKKEIYAKLMALKELTEEAIDAVIGNHSWTRFECSECQQDVPVLILFERYESYIELCEGCLTKALDAIKTGLRPVKNK